MKFRNQNPVIGDLIRLKFYTQNSNLFSDVFNIDHVEIIEEECKDRLRIDKVDKDILPIETIPASSIIHDDMGIYHIDLQTSSPQYVIKRYHDVWYTQFREGDVLSPVKQDFQIYPDLWITSPTPVVYSFDFHFTPNRIRQGSIKWLIIQIVPNVPRATDLERYYHNLAISSDLIINIEQNCGPCVPQEEDLRMVVENQPVTERDKVFSY